MLAPLLDQRLGHPQRVIESEILFFAAEINAKLAGVTAQYGENQQAAASLRRAGRCAGLSVIPCVRAA